MPASVRVKNSQQRVPVPLAAMRRLAQCAVRSLRIRARGILEITFINGAKMRRLNKRFLAHDYVTDVLSFRYADDQAVVGEILIAPSQARAYARKSRLPYKEELSRYVVHGLLHWLGFEDRTPRERSAMRRREDALLGRCGIVPQRTRMARA